MRRPLAFLLLLVALLGAGCGGGNDDGSGGGNGKPLSKEAYRRQLDEAGTSLGQVLSGIGDAQGSGVTPKAIGARFDAAATRLDQAAKRFQSITPPADVKATHAKLVASLQELADVCRTAAKAARANDAKAFTAALKELSGGEAIRKLGQVQAELKAKGVATSSTPSG